MSRQPKNTTVAQAKARAELTELRQKLSVLKKKNIAFKKKDLRSYTKPTRYAKSLVAKIEKTGLFEGKARVQAVSRKEERLLRELGEGYIKGGKVILPANEAINQRIVKRGKHSAIEEYSEGILREKSLVSFEDWEDWLEGMRIKWEDFRSNGYRLAFKFYGHLSREAFDDIDALLDKLYQYQAKQPDLNKNIQDNWQDVVQNIEIFKIDRHKYIDKRKKLDSFDRRKRGRKQKKQYDTYVGKITRVKKKGGKTAVRQFVFKETERLRKYRAGLSEAQKEQINENRRAAYAKNAKKINRQRRAKRKAK